MATSSSSSRSSCPASSAAFASSPAARCPSAGWDAQRRVDAAAACSTLRAQRPLDFHREIFVHDGVVAYTDTYDVMTSWWRAFQHDIVAPCGPQWRMTSIVLLAKELYTIL